MNDTDRLQLLQRAILENVSYGIISTTPDGTVTSFNPAAERMLGYTADEIVGKQTPAYWHDSEEIGRRAMQLSEELGETVTAGFDVFAARPRRRLPEEGEWTFIRKDGERIPVNLSVTALWDKSGHITGFVGLTYDLSERKRAEAALAASEQQFRSLAENSPDNVVRYDRQYRARYYNPRMVQTLGVDPEKILGKTPLELGAGGLESDTEYEGHIRRALESGESSDMELTISHPGGGISNHLIRFAAERDTRGNITGVLAIGRDITERKRVEDALLFVAQRGWQISGENFFDALAQFLGEKLEMDYVLIDRIDENQDMAETVALYAKGAITPNMRYALKGTPCENVMGRRLCVYPHGIQQLFPEDTLLPAMGAESYIGIPLWDSTGRPIGLIAVMGNKPIPDDAPVTQLLQLVATRAAAELERKRSDHLLRAREQEFRSLAENLPDNIARWDREGRYLYINPTHELTLQTPEVEVLGKRMSEVFPDGRFDHSEQVIETVVETGQAQLLNRVEVPQDDGFTRIHEVSFVPERNAQGEIVSVLGIGRDITERTLAEKSLTEYAAIVESTDDAIVGKTLDGIITSWNKGAERMLGYRAVEIIGHSILVLIPDERHHEEQEILEQVRRGESVRHYETVRRCKDGHLIDISVAVSPLRNPQGKTVGVSKIARDITERKQKEALLHSLSRKLKAVSRCNHMLVRAENEQELLNGICKLVCDEAGYLMAWVGFAENDEDKTVRPVAQSGYENGYLDGIQITWADTERGQVPIGIAIRTGVAAINHDFQSYPGLAPWREAAIRRGFRSSVAIPLVSKGQVLGSLNIYSAELQVFENEEVELLQELANDIAYGVLTLRTRGEKERAEAEVHVREQEFRAMIENSPDNIARYDAQCRRIYVNPALQASFDVPIAEILGTTSEYKSPLLDVPDYMQRMQNALKTGCEERMEISWISPQGVERWGDVRLSPEFGKDGAVVSLLSITRDITERKRAEEKLLITASVFDNTQEAILITDANSSIIDVNSAFTKITGYSREEVIGKNPKVLNSGRQDKAFYAAMWQSLEHKRVWRGEIWNRRKTGEIYAELLSISTICDNKGKVLRYVGVFSDISYLKEHETELSRVANYDALTGIPNRVLLADRMRQAIAQTVREQNMMAVCYLDLDGFKPINDSMGHDAGDQVLIEAARRIENTIRGGDTVARLGGDEFVVLLLGQEKGEECTTTLERLLTAIAHPIVVKNKSITISASIGVSIYPLDNEDPDTLLRHADQAMYIAKQSGKNRFLIYDPAQEQHARDQNKFMESIHHGLEHGQFELYYQPKVNLRTKALVGAEALIRWRHPERGLLSPAEFLRHIENTDLDVEIGEWVTATALAQMNHWRNTGLDIEVSINISGYHMESPRFAEKLGQQLAHYPDMPPGKLQIEVLETVALNDITIVCEIIESCRKLGIGFALDDFGTGYSSLSYLSGLPVDVLKIDQSFVRDMLEDKGDMAIVQGIIALARAFDRQTVAEGIETEEHYRVLLDMGCELGQGYGIGRPMPANELLSWRPNSHF